MPCLTCKRCLAFIVCMSEKEECFLFALGVPVLNSQQSQGAYHLHKDPDATQREGRMAISQDSRVHAWPQLPLCTSGACQSRDFPTLWPALKRLLCPHCHPAQEYTGERAPQPSQVLSGWRLHRPFPALGLGGFQAWLRFLHTVGHCVSVERQPTENCPQIGPFS